MNNSIKFLDYFMLLDEPRVSGCIKYPANELLLLTLCAVISGCNDWKEIQEYGEHKLEFLRSLLPFKNGIASYQTIRRFFSAIDHDYFSLCFTAWAESLAKHVEGVIAIDGKTIRGSRSGDKKPLHVISAFAHAQGIVISQAKVDDKSNEISAIPGLLDKLKIKGAIITADAMATQTEIVDKIVEKEADYILALKGNQGRLYDDVRIFFEEQHANYWPDTDPAYHEELDYGHGRIETRKCWVLEDIDWLNLRHPDWKNLNSIIMIESIRDFKNKNKIETSVRFYISSLEADAVKIANSVRNHWSIENNLHWSMDVIFRDDLNNTSNDNGAMNLHMIKQTALNMLKRKIDQKRKSIKIKRKIANWSNDYLMDILKC